MTILVRPAQKDFSNPFENRPGKKRHSGLDYGHGAGLDVYAAADGVVVHVETNGGHGGGWGNRIVIHHGNGIYTSYNHLRKNGVLVHEGDTVRAGQQIGIQGNTETTDVHLHFELMFGGWGPGNRVDPAPFFHQHLPGTAPAPIPASSGSSLIGGNEMYIARVTHGKIRGNFLVTPQGTAQPTALGLGGNATFGGFPVVDITDFSEAFWKTVRLV